MFLYEQQITSLSQRTPQQTEFKWLHLESSGLWKTSYYISFFFNNFYLDLKVAKKYYKIESKNKWTDVFSKV